MSKPVYEFLPWLRSSAGSAVRAPDGEGDLPARAGFEVGVHLNEGAVAATTTRLEVAGPGDVVGIDPRHVVRRVPSPGTSDFEPNLFCTIEFDRPELPWLATPAGPNTGTQRLRPWAVLVVVDETPGVSLEPRQPLPVLRITAPASPDEQLPDLAESWAWAHAQVLVEDGDTATAAGIARTNPALALSRLICPRRLVPARPYIACVVPAFDLGARRGLGNVAPGTTAGPAWRRGSGTDPLELPVYLHWRFATGEAGDFETLARRLAARELPDELGRRALFVGAGGPGLPEIAAGGGAIADLGGALVPAGRTLVELDAAVAGRLATALEAATAADGGASGDEVRAPRYGAAAIGGAPPPWFEQLNLEPTSRAAAGLGSRAVREHQEELVFGAWSQAGQLGEANDKLRGLDFAAAVGGSLRRRHLTPLTVGQAMQATGPSLHRIAHAAASAARALHDSPVPDEFVDPRYRKAVSMAARRGAALDRAAPVAEALNTGAVRPEPPPVPPDGAVATVIRAQLTAGASAPAEIPGTGISLDAAIAAGLAGTTAGGEDVAVDVGHVRAQPLPAAFEPVRELTVLGAVAAGVASATGIVAEHEGNRVIVDGGTRISSAPGPRVVMGESFTVPGTVFVREIITRPTRRDRPPVGPVGPIGPVGPVGPVGPRPPVRVQHVTEIDRGTLGQLLEAESTQLVFGTAARRPALHLRTPAFLEQFVIPNVLVELPGGRPTTTAPLDPGSPARLQGALVAHLEATVDTPVGETVREPADLGALGRALGAATDPAAWSVARARAAVATGPAIGDDPLTLGRVRGAPQLTRPLAELLAAIDPDLLVPGIAALPADSVSLFQTDTRFAQAALAGANHELGRELLWRGFPLDPAATPLDRFWRRSRPLPDVSPMLDWAGGLGDAFDLAGDDQQIVLLLRSGLVLRYPGTILQLIDASWTPEGKRIPKEQSNPEPPIFAGRLDPDVLYAGFDRSLADVLGADDPSGSPGRFFVVEQPPTEPMFGLDEDDAPRPDPPNRWRDLSWGHLARTRPVGQVRFAEAGAFGGPLTREGLTWGATAADHAAITLQDPVRVAVHARDLFAAAEEG